MAREKFIEHRFNKKAKAVIEHVNRILANYTRQGFDLTLRGVYYQLVAHDLFPDDRRWTWTGSKWIRDGLRLRSC